MTKMESISYKTILLYLTCELSMRTDKGYREEYHSIYSSIVEKIRSRRYVTAGRFDKIKLQISEVWLNRMTKVHHAISLYIDKYLEGEITDANEFFLSQWRELHIPRYQENCRNRVFYRMRLKKEDENDFTISDLLHIPIDKREIITNQRYSITGFPCLYASTSLYQCWEELRRPHLQELYATGLLFTNDNFTLLDLRLIRNVKNKKQLETFMIRLPFIIACSIKTKDDKAKFKAEYIIPQILLHTIINKKNNIDGILYSSARKDYNYFRQDENIEDCSKNENVVIPAKVHSEKGFLVDNLKKGIEITQPLNFEQEIIKGFISFNKTELYEETIFGQMEQRIMSTRVYKADNLDFIILEKMQARLESKSNKIRIV